MSKIKMLIYSGFILIIILSAIFTAGCTADYNITLEAKPEKAGKLTGEGTYKEGQKATLTAEAEEGYEFVMWTANGEKVSTDKTFQLMVEGDKKLNAIFYPYGFQEEVLKLSEEAFSVYLGYGNPSIFTSSAKQELEKGNLNIDYPAVNNFRDDIEIDLDMEFKNEEKIEVKALIKYPHIDENKFDKFKEKITEKIISKANEGTINLSEVYSQVLKDQSLSSKETSKNMTIKKVEDELQVINMDPPGEILLSFDEFYQYAVADQIDEVLVNIDKDNVFGGDGVKEAATARFSGIQINIVGPAIDPNYLLNETSIILADTSIIPLNTIWEQLVQQVDYEPFLNFGPENYFNRIEFRKVPDHDKKSIYLTRPYAVLTMDSVIGYVDEEMKKINLFNKISGPGNMVSDFFWAPNGDFLAYSYTESGSGFVNLDVYDIKEDKVIQITNLNDFKEHYDIKHGFIGKFSNFKWSETGNIFYFNVKEVDYSNGEEDTAKESISWRFNVEDKKLKVNG
ncbi:hypothetical protein SYNTR_0035 [Candidatus Syntrophocurvum alkaliphilum]|uniref:Bacterial repeat domain-containing protein n=1 Tax=Candidatus Syntrophocurvum alkaliphilum TaxID=2293317 RepID=A0A6I6DDC5_9FIRM|nr:hypothetical protein [Candidatus Syntrophocurvum alkaliphilum]QGT98628.1 hypothetical protein SYNTR_0035 [Candidatus Syntrophocurvum alkaliphilum]